MTDEGPDSEDLERFGGETAFCPDCGEEVWDQAGACPSCGAILGGETASRGPLGSRMRRIWITVIAVIALLAFAIAILGRW